MSEERSVEMPLSDDCILEVVQHDGPTLALLIESAAALGQRGIDL